MKLDLSAIPAKTYLAVGGALAILGVVGWIYASGRSDEAAVLKPKIEAAVDDGTARGLEVGGAQQSTIRTEATLARESRVQERTNAFIADTRSRPTAPLDAGAAARLRAHDRVLCDEAPGVCAVVAPAGGDATNGG